MFVGRYPPGRQQSAIIPLLDLAQRQIGAETETQGWLPIPVIEFVAAELGMPYIRAYEVATFYTMFNLAPVGRHHVQVCGTTPCMLRGSDDVLAACYAKGLKKGHTTADGLFTLTEVECLGACANAPMVQINDDNYEDLTFESMTAILDALARGETPKPGPQIERQTSCPEGGPTTLHGDGRRKSRLSGALVVRCLGRASALLGACQQAEAPANNAAAPRPRRRAATATSRAAERLVRASSATPARPASPMRARSASDGVPIVCGDYRAGRRSPALHRRRRRGGLRRAADARRRDGPRRRRILRRRQRGYARERIMSASSPSPSSPIWLLIKVVELVFKLIAVGVRRGRRRRLSSRSRRIGGR